MRYLVLFVLPFAISAQTADSGEKLTQALISEIQQLRLAIERSTLLGARTQLAISQMQMQEAAVARLTTQLNDVRGQAPGLAGLRNRLNDTIQQFEQKRTAPEWSTPGKKDELESIVKQSKLDLEQANASEVARSAREGELASQLQTAQAQITDSRNRIAEMERALDAAIQQLLLKK